MWIPELYPTPATGVSRRSGHGAARPAPARGALTRPEAAAELADRTRPVRVFHGFSSFERGGPQTRVAGLIDRFGPRCRHIVTALDDCFDAATLAEEPDKLELLRLHVSKGMDFANLGLMRAVLSDVRPDVIFTYGWGGIEWVLASRACAAPVYHVEEGFCADETDRRFRRRSLVRAAALRLTSAKLVVVSDTTARIARREWFVPSSKLIRIPNGIDAQRYRNALTRAGASRFSRDGELVVGTVAGMRPVKRLDRFLEAIAICRHVGLAVRGVIAGDGPLRASLEERAAALGIGAHVDFLGFVAEPADLYREFDVFALTSDSEQMPFALMEAMASGLCVVATDVGDARSMLPEAGADHQLAPRDAGAVARAVQAHAGAPMRRQRLAAANREHVASAYSWSRMMLSWARLYLGEDVEGERF